MADTLLRVAAVVIGIVGMLAYFRSIVLVMFLNRRERDLVERGARFAAVTIVHRLAGDGQDYERVQRLQAWVLPLFLFFAVAFWFLLVQCSFTLILWGLDIVPTLAHAFSSSGSALSTLGFATPPSLGGQLLAIYEAAIGLAVVVLLFTFVPSYQAAIRVRERKVGWLYARTGRRPTSVNLLESLKRSGHLDHPTGVWEGWEDWFRGVLETHSLAPILAYVPAVYRGTTWVGAATAVLDATSLLLACLDEKETEAARICRDTGVTAVRLIAIELHQHIPADAWASHRIDAGVMATFNPLYETLIEIGLPVKPNREECRDRFVTLRAEYEASILHIAKSTMMPVDQPWALPHVPVAPVGPVTPK